LGTKAIVDQATKPGQAPPSPPPSVPPSGTSDPLPGRTPAPPAAKQPGFPELTEIDASRLADVVEHIGGASKDGEDQK
jgi:hypothetical protein